MRYTLLVSRNYECAATLLSIVAAAEGHSLPVEDIVEHFGIGVPPEYIGPVRNKHVVHDPNDYGSKIMAGDISNFFAKTGIPLVETFTSARKLTDFEIGRFCSEKLRSGRHLIFGFDYGRLNDGRANRVGHVGLITGVVGDEVEYYDPGPLNVGLKRAREEDIHAAMLAKGDGFWIVSRAGVP